MCVRICNVSARIVITKSNKKYKLAYDRISWCHCSLHAVASELGDEGIDRFLPVLNPGDNPPDLSGKTACKNYVKLQGL